MLVASEYFLHLIVVPARVCLFHWDGQYNSGRKWTGTSIFYIIRNFSGPVVIESTEIRSQILQIFYLYCNF